MLIPPTHYFSYIRVARQYVINTLQCYKKELFRRRKSILIHLLHTYVQGEYLSSNVFYIYLYFGNSLVDIGDTPQKSDYLRAF